MSKYGSKEIGEELIQRVMNCMVHEAAYETASLNVLAKRTAMEILFQAMATTKNAPEQNIYD